MDFQWDIERLGFHFRLGYHPWRILESLGDCFCSQLDSRRCPVGIRFAVKIRRSCISCVEKGLGQIEDFNPVAFEEFVKIAVVFYEICRYLRRRGIARHELVRVNRGLGWNGNKEEVDARFVQLFLEIQNRRKGVVRVGLNSWDFIPESWSGKMPELLVQEKPPIYPRYGHAGTGLRFVHSGFKGLLELVTDGWNGGICCRAEFKPTRMEEHYGSQAPQNKRGV